MCSETWKLCPAGHTYHLIKFWRNSDGNFFSPDLFFSSKFQMCFFKVKHSCPYLRNGWSTWCEIKRLCIGWALGELCDLDFWPHHDLNSLRPSDCIWRHRPGSTLAQVMACCLTAPSHYLNQCWLIISKVQLHSSDGNFTRDTSVISVTKN